METPTERRTSDTGSEVLRAKLTEGDRRELASTLGCMHDQQAIEENTLSRARNLARRLMCNAKEHDIEEAAHEIAALAFDLYEFAKHTHLMEELAGGTEDRG